jgi:hypothetical protein
VYRGRHDCKISLQSLCFTLSILFFIIVIDFLVIFILFKIFIQIYSIINYVLILFSNKINYNKYIIIFNFFNMMNNET